MDRLTEVFDEPVDLILSSTDPELTHVKVFILTGAAIYLNLIVLRDVGGRPGPPRGIELVEQVVAAAFQTFSDTDPYPDPFSKAAMLLRGVTQGHPFEDGNKRTGYLLATYYLWHVGFPPPGASSQTAIEQLCLRVSSGELRRIDDIRDEIERIWGEAHG